MDIEKRLEALETKASFQDSAIQELSEQVYLQGKELASLVRKLDELTRRLVAIQSATNDSDSDTGDDLPPHY